MCRELPKGLAAAAAVGPPLPGLEEDLLGREEVEPEREGVLERKKAGEGALELALPASEEERAEKTGLVCPKEALWLLLLLWVPMKDRRWSIGGSCSEEGWKGEGERPWGPCWLRALSRGGKGDEKGAAAADPQEARRSLNMGVESERQQQRCSRGGGGRGRG